MRDTDTSNFNAGFISDEAIANGIGLDLLRDPSFIVDGNKVITWANNALLQAFNLKSSVLAGKMTCEEACGTQLCGTKNCPVGKAERLKKSADAEIIRTDGTDGPIYFHSTATPIDGDDPMTLVSLQEITEKKQLEAQLRQLETDLNVIPTPIMEIDVRFNVTYINPAGAAMANTTVDEAVGKKCWDLFCKDHCRTQDCGVARAMREDAVNSSQTVAHIGGRDIPVQATSVSIKDAKGNIKGGLEYMVDVTAETKVKQLISNASEEVATLVKDSGHQMDQSASAMDEMIKSLGSFIPGGRNH